MFSSIFFLINTKNSYIHLLAVLVSLDLKLSVTTFSFGSTSAVVHVQNTKVILFFYKNAYHDDDEYDDGIIIIK